MAAHEASLNAMAYLQRNTLVTSDDVLQALAALTGADAVVAPA